MNNFRRDMPAWGISILLNATLLLTFHMVTWTIRATQNDEEIVSVMDDVVQQEMIFQDAIANDQVGQEGQTLSISPSMAASTGAGPSERPLDEQVNEVVNPDIPQLVEANIAIPENVSLTETVTGAKGVSDKVGGGAAGVMDRLTFEIRQSVKERQTLVIWVFDASSSMKLRREEIVKRFDTVYKQLDQEHATDGLYTAIVSYGEKVNILTPEPVRDVKPLVDVVQKIPDDVSGKEVVFAAVGQAVDKWKAFRKNDGKWNKLVFVVTDERGDDDAILEEVISTCKRTHTRVFTVGNAAVFGQKQGFVKWTYEDGFEEYLPVDQGPETYYPEGLQLPSWGEGGDWQANMMSAAYGPYALTRLSAETGGMYLLSVDVERGKRFDHDVMRNYAPDYRPIRQQEEDLRKSMAKSALVATADLTYKANGQRSLPVPATVFRGYNDNILREELGEAQKPVATVEYEIKRLLQALEAGEKDRDKIREARWRAAYDLALGRLLALYVRYDGYNRMLAAMKVSPKAFTKKESNEWHLVPSSNIESGVEIKKIADRAKKYLKRVIDEHPGTPWAELAEKELRLDMGWTWEEGSRPLPEGMMGQNLNDEDAARLLLAEEEQVQRRMQGPPPKPRDRPKL